LRDIDVKLPRSECFDENGQEYDERTKDKIWGQKHTTKMVRQVKRAKHAYEHKKERETPLTLLKAAIKKLDHEDMDPDALSNEDYPRAMRLAGDIKKRADQLEGDFCYCHKKNKKLPRK
jgi:hypothetical protein